LTFFAYLYFDHDAFMHHALHVMDDPANSRPIRLFNDAPIPKMIIMRKKQHIFAVYITVKYDYV